MINRRIAAPRRRVGASGAADRLSIISGPVTSAADCPRGAAARARPAGAAVAGTGRGRGTARAAVQRGRWPAAPTALCVVALVLLAISVRAEGEAGVRADETGTSGSVTDWAQLRWWWAALASGGAAVVLAARVPAVRRRHPHRQPRSSRSPSRYSRPACCPRSSPSSRRCGCSPSSCGGSCRAARSDSAPSARQQRAARHDDEPGRLDHATPRSDRALQHVRVVQARSP